MAHARLLRELFVVFLRARRMARHFGRRTLPASLTATGVSREPPPELAATLFAASAGAPASVLGRLASRAEGLAEEDAAAARTAVGPNEIEHEKPLPWWLHLWHCYTSPFSLLLTVLALVSYATGDARATAVIALMIALATVIRFWQESKSNRAADRLKAMVTNTATVLRPDAHGARRVEVPIALLVPGDVVELAAGDMIPADCRILRAQDLFVNQAAMTGESLPAEKYPVQRRTGTRSPLDLDNLLFMGTNVVSGSATAVVIATGRHSYFGALARRVVTVEAAPTEFQAGVNRLAWLLIRFVLVMAPLVLLINGFTKGDWLQAALFALSIAVGLTPEMLPMIVTSTLARGAVVLARRKVVVKRLDAIQNFGAMDVLCTDKTGTLTQDKVFLKRHLDPWGGESEAVLKYAFLNSRYQTGLRNLLDVAILEHEDLHELAAAFRSVDEIPFDFQRRRMSVVVAQRDAPHLLVCKGAVEEVLAACTRVRRGDRDEPLTAAVLAEMRDVTATLHEEGLRVVAVAVRELPPVDRDYRVPDEADLSLVGYVSFLDPPKDSAAPALQALARLGVAFKVLTGDNERVTAKICREVGLPSGGALLGAQVEAMNDADLARAAEAHTVFAKLTPTQKDRIVLALKRNGHVVGYIGDGINDAAALRAADIGISVDSGVDIAKEAADIVLLEKSLLVLKDGVVEGRRTFANMLKYIKLAASSNFGNVLSVLAASAFIPFLPMLPMHLLVQNLIYDISQVAIPFDNVDDELVRRPQRWHPVEIGRFMLYFGPISSVFDLTTYAVMWFVFSADTPAEQTLFQSGWFVVGLLTQSMIVHMIRTPGIPFLHSRPAAPLLAATLLTIAAGLLIPMGPFAHYFKLQALPPAYFPILAGILLGYLTLTQLMKGFYVRRFGWQ